VPQEYLDLIKEGMREVVSAEDGGTAGEYFKDWKYSGQIGGKTGTGKVSDVDLENNAWFVAFAPYDDPEIAVVSYIPNGLGGTYAIPAARDIIEFYLDGKEEQKETAIPYSNTLLTQ
jgi:penicillin-binding protein 2